MKAWQIHQFGSLTQAEVDVPQPGPGQVRVEVRACSINYRDHLMVAGHYDPRLALPAVPLSDGAGVIAEVGEGVDGWAVGDRVAGTFFADWDGWPVPDRRRLRLTRGGPLPGMLAEQVVLGASEIVRVPDHLGFDEAATLPCAALTAWSALIAQGDLRPGHVVLVQGTGGVALFSVAFAKMCGARVIITSSSDERLERARALGADVGVNYMSDPNWGKTVAKMGGVTHVVELGGADTLAQSLKCVRPGGFIALIGVLSGTRAPAFDLLPAVMQNVRLQGVLVGPKAEFEAMNRALVERALHPVIARRGAFGEADAALAEFPKGGHFGKVVITFD